MTASKGSRVPTAGESHNVSLVFVVPLTDALNFADWPDFSDAADGVKGTTPIVGLSEIVELAVALTSAKAVAVRTTVWGVLMIIGAL